MSSRVVRAEKWKLGALPWAWVRVDMRVVVRRRRRREGRDWEDEGGGIVVVVVVVRIRAGFVSGWFVKGALVGVLWERRARINVCGFGWAGLRWFWNSRRRARFWVGNRRRGNGRCIDMRCDAMRCNAIRRIDSVENAADMEGDYSTARDPLRRE
jgi:hypothetical protein